MSLAMKNLPYLSYLLLQVQKVHEAACATHFSGGTAGAYAQDTHLGINICMKIKD